MTAGIGIHLQSRTIVFLNRETIDDVFRGEKVTAQEAQDIAYYVVYMINPLLVLDGEPWALGAETEELRDYLANYYEGDFEVKELGERKDESV